MNKILFLLLVSAVHLTAAQPSQLYGEWIAERKTSINGSTNTRYEDLRFNPGSFMVTVHLTVQKEDYLIEDMQIEGRGIWKVSGDILVYVISEVRAIGVRKTVGISQESINKLARDIQKKYMDDPVRISKIQSIGSDTLINMNESSEVIQYRRK